MTETIRQMKAHWLLFIFVPLMYWFLDERAKAISQGADQERPHQWKKRMIAAKCSSWFFGPRAAITVIVLFFAIVIGLYL